MAKQNGKWNNSEKAQRLRTYSPFRDNDADGVPNWKDCQPLNPYEHGFWSSVVSRVRSVISAPFRSVQRSGGRAMARHTQSVRSSVYSRTSARGRTSYSGRATSRASSRGRRVVKKYAPGVVRKVVKRISKVGAAAKSKVIRKPEGMSSRFKRGAKPTRHAYRGIKRKPSVLAIPRGGIKPIRKAHEMISAITRRGEQKPRTVVAKTTAMAAIRAVRHIRREVPKVKAHVTTYIKREAPKAKVRATTYIKRGVPKVVGMVSAPVRRRVSGISEQPTIAKFIEFEKRTSPGYIAFKKTREAFTWKPKAEREFETQVQEFQTRTASYKRTPEGAIILPTKPTGEYTEQSKAIIAQQEAITKRAEQLSDPLYMAKERTKGMRVAPVVTKAYEFGDWWGKKVASPVEKMVKIGREYKPTAEEKKQIERHRAMFGLPPETRIEKKMGYAKGEIVKGMVKGVPDVPIMAAEVGYAGEYIREQPKEAAMIAPGVAAYMATGMAKEAVEHPAEFTGRMATMALITGGIGKAVSPILPKYVHGVKLTDAGRISYKGIGIRGIKEPHPVIGMWKEVRGAKGKKTRTFDVSLPKTERVPTTAKLTPEQYAQYLVERGEISGVGFASKKWMERGGIKRAGTLAYDTKLTDSGIVVYPKKLKAPAVLLHPSLKHSKITARTQLMGDVGRYVFREKQVPRLKDIKTQYASLRGQYYPSTSEVLAHELYHFKFPKASEATILRMEEAFRLSKTKKVFDVPGTKLHIKPPSFKTGWKITEQTPTYSIQRALVLGKEYPALRYLKDIEKTRFETPWLGKGAGGWRTITTKEYGLGRATKFEIKKAEALLGKDVFLGKIKKPPAKPERLGLPETTTREIMLWKRGKDVSLAKRPTAITLFEEPISVIKPRGIRIEKRYMPTITELEAGRLYKAEIGYKAFQIGKYPKHTKILGLAKPKEQSFGTTGFIYPPKGVGGVVPVRQLTYKSFGRLPPAMERYIRDIKVKMGISVIEEPKVVGMMEKWEIPIGEGIPTWKGWTPKKGIKRKVDVWSRIEGEKTIKPIDEFKITPLSVFKLDVSKLQKPYRIVQIGDTKTRVPRKKTPSIKTIQEKEAEITAKIESGEYLAHTGAKGVITVQKLVTKQKQKPKLKPTVKEKHVTEIKPRDIAKEFEETTKLYKKKQRKIFEEQQETVVRVTGRQRPRVETPHAFSMPPKIGIGTPFASIPLIGARERDKERERFRFSPFVGEKEAFRFFQPEAFIHKEAVKQKAHEKAGVAPFVGQAYKPIETTKEKTAFKTTPPPQLIAAFPPIAPPAPTITGFVEPPPFFLPFSFRDEKKRKHVKSAKKAWEWLEEFTVQRPEELHFGAIESGIPKVSKVTMLPTLTMDDITPTPRKTKDLKGKKTNRRSKRK